MFAHDAFGQAEVAGELPVGGAAGEPSQEFDLAWGEGGEAAAFGLDPVAQFGQVWARVAPSSWRAGTDGTPSRPLQ